ncbi:MAG: HAD-IA family hydrolase [Alphaproteobacteria bacterium]|nr:HAD-IA family hydrolase [Alphaproteobacteria bacterium]
MKVLVFDFFGVICSEIAPFLLPKYMSTDAAIAYKATVVRDADLGVISQQQMFDDLSRIARVPAQRLEEEFRAEVRIDPKVVGIVDRARKKHRVALLTNAIVPFVREVMAQHDLERLFETILVSAEEGLAKPDPAYYARLLERMKAAPSEALMIDDNPENLIGAKKAGMRALRFQTAEQLERDLALNGETAADPAR